MTVDESEKARIMDGCIEKMPSRWYIGGECFKRAAVLGKGSWAVAFSAKRVNHRPQETKMELSQDKSQQSELQSTMGSSSATSDHSSESEALREQDWTLVRQPPYGELIAVKVIVKEAHSVKSMEKYPKREVEIMRNLSGNDHVVKLHAFWQDDLCFYLAMELCANRSLSMLIKSKDRSKILELMEIKRYLREMLLGCQYIHQSLVVHRDIKPDNVLLDHLRHIKIGDFGLSAQLSSPTELLQSICGTPKYQAPEMIRKLGYSFPIDIWACGCILYRLWYQVAPFDGLQSVEIYEKLLSSHVTYPSTDRYGRLMGEHELRVVRSMLKKNPKFRATVESLLADTTFFQESPASEAASSSTVVPPSSLEHLLHCLEQITRSTPSVQNQRLNYAQFHTDGLLPSFWIHQWNIENQSGMAYYQYNNANLFGCTFRDQTRLLCINQRTLVYNCDRGRQKFFCFDFKDAANQEEELRKKIQLLQTKRQLTATRRHSRSQGAGGQAVQLDRKHLDRLPWLELRMQIKGNRRYLKANGYHLRLGPKEHLFQLGYLYGGTARANRNRTKCFILDTSHNSLTVQRHSEQMYAVSLDFVAAGNCTATMRKFVQYALKYINALRNAEQRPRH